MVLKILSAVATSKYFPSNYLVHIGLVVLACLVVRAFSQGRKTIWERDLHARTILVTGGFTSLGLTVLQSLAERGAHIIALSEDPVDSPDVLILIDLLRTTTKNERIYAEHCALESPHSIREFCTKFLTGKDQRLDAILFMHEYQHIGALSWLARALGRRRVREEANQRERGSLASFLITTLLLPALLVAPVERDIRIIHVVNPFYAAAARTSFHAPNSSFSSSDGKRATKKSIILEEGTRSLRTVILTRHLQRILDALPSAAKAQVPKTEEGSTTVPVVSPKLQKSNIVAVSVSPGISRMDTVAPLLSADWNVSQGASVKGVVVYLFLQPLLRLLTKSPTSAIQSILHALFLPTPFKGLSQSSLPDPEAEQQTASTSPPKAPQPQPKPSQPREVLKPGALYSECAVVQLRVPPPTEDQLKELKDAKPKSADGAKTESAKKKGKAKASPEVLQLEEDDEYGGEVAGRLVWEAYEDALKFWEKSSPPPPASSKPQFTPQKPTTSKTPDAPSTASPYD